MYLLCEKVAGNVTNQRYEWWGGIVLTESNILYVLGLRELNVIVQVQCRITILILLNKCQENTVIIKSTCL